MAQRSAVARKTVARGNGQDSSHTSSPGLTLPATVTTTTTTTTTTISGSLSLPSMSRSNSSSGGRHDHDPSYSQQLWLPRRSPRSPDPASRRSRGLSFDAAETQQTCRCIQHQRLLSENIALREDLAAERAFTAKLLAVLQTFHETEGRVNPEPGRFNSVYYKTLKDEYGGDLVRPFVAAGGGWVDVDNDAEGDGDDGGGGGGDNGDSDDYGYHEDDYDDGDGAFVL